ncbi:MAG: hypothetical protein OEZ00_07720 [Dehalococcoidia bacterium]|nr:hypothetical protein [Dehalococcoidia bacterium]
MEIAIALATEPELLLTDEPATGLNQTEAAELEHLIQLIHNMGITLLIIEHNMQVIMRVCQRLAVLDFGVKIADGTPKEIAQAQGVIKAYLGESRNA